MKRGSDMIFAVNEVGSVSEVNYTFVTDGEKYLPDRCGTAFVGLPYAREKFSNRKHKCHVCKKDACLETTEGANWCVTCWQASPRYDAKLIDN